jgi:hypothetical protein
MLIEGGEHSEGEQDLAYDVADILGWCVLCERTIDNHVSARTVLRVTWSFSVDQGVCRVPW